MARTPAELAEAQAQAVSPFFPEANVNRIGGDTALHLSLQEFNEALVIHGSALEYRRQVLCPCMRIETQGPDVSCEHCRGLGRLYPESMRDPLIVLDASRSATLKWAAAGLMASGTITLTFPCGIVPGVGDMVLPHNDVHVVNEILFRDGTRRVTNDHLRAAVEPLIAGQSLRALRPQDERLMYPTDDVCVEAVYYVDAAGKLVAARERTEWTLGPDNVWKWLGDAGPPSGGAWTVRYRAPAAYVIHESAPALRQEASVNMPYRVQAKRLDKVSPDDLR